MSWGVWMRRMGWRRFNLIAGMVHALVEHSYSIAMHSYNPNRLTKHPCPFPHPSEWWEGGA